MRRPRTVADLGERGLLRSISKYLDRPSRDLLVGAPDDDAAVWRGDPFVVATTDTMVEEIDFRQGWPGFDFFLIGRRLISINLSDLAAMGAQPRHALVSLALQRMTKASDVSRLYRGIAQQAHHFGATVAGGDLSVTDGPMTMTATLIGSIQSPRRVLRRTGARPGWQLAVTGRLGAAAAGLQLLEAGRDPTTRAERAWVSAQLDPTPQVAAGTALVDAGVTVGGDISDGLYREVERLVEPAQLGARIAIDHLPLAAGLRHEQWALAVKDSEDFQLVCAVPASRIVAAQEALARRGIALTVVGRIERRRGIRLHDGRKLVRLPGAGYDHFR
jgi:thiamine-monophosphate kinase